MKIKKDINFFWQYLNIIAAPVNMKQMLILGEE